MNETKRKKLEAKGWKFGDAKDFLGLTDQEATMVEVKVRLAGLLRAKRKARHWGQKQVATLAGSSQSRVAKMEKADKTVSVDLLFRSLIAVGASVKEIGKSLEKEPVSAGSH